MCVCVSVKRRSFAASRRSNELHSETTTPDDKLQNIARDQFIDELHSDKRMAYMPSDGRDFRSNTLDNATYYCNKESMIAITASSARLLSSNMHAVGHFRHNRTRAAAEAPYCSGGGVGINEWQHQ